MLSYRLFFVSFILHVCSSNLSHAADRKLVTPEILIAQHSNFAGSCSATLKGGLPYQLIEPWFHPDNWAAQETPLVFMKHRLGGAFQFSSNDRYALVTHSIYPNGEQYSLRLLEDGSTRASLIWKSKAESLFSTSARSLSDDGIRFLFQGAHQDQIHDNQILSWTMNSNNSPIKVEIPGPKHKDFKWISSRAEDHFYRSPLSMDSPYFVRTDLRTPEFQRGRQIDDSHQKLFSAQIVDWLAGQTISLTGVNVKYLKVIPQPVNTLFRVVAVLGEDGRSIELVGFDDVSQKMNSHLRWRDWLSLNFKSKLWPRATVLSHRSMIKKVEMSENQPTLVSLDQRGLSLWNIQTGLMVNQISEPFVDFRLLPHKQIVAALTESGDLKFISLRTGDILDSLNRFEGARGSIDILKNKIFDLKEGSVFLQSQEGEIFELRNEVTSNDGKGIFKLFSLGHHFKFQEEGSHSLTSITTSMSRYIVATRIHTLEVHPQLAIEAYRMGEVPLKKVSQWSFPVSHFWPEFSLNPKGDIILFTSSDTTTGIIRLKELFRVNNL